MSMKTRVTILAAALTVALAVPAFAEEQATPPRLTWSFAGPFGKYNEAQLQRGFKIYREVCSNCHSLNLLSFRNLADVGGPGFSEAQVAQIASEYKINDLDDSGQPASGLRNLSLTGNRRGKHAAGAALRSAGPIRAGAAGSDRGANDSSGESLTADSLGVRRR